MTEIPLAKLRLGTRFYLAMTDGRRIYGTLLDLTPSSAHVQVDGHATRTFTTRDGEQLTFTAARKIEHWDYETLVVPEKKPR